MRSVCWTIRLVVGMGRSLFNLEYILICRESQCCKLTWTGRTLIHFTDEMQGPGRGELTGPTVIKTDAQRSSLQCREAGMQSWVRLALGAPHSWANGSHQWPAREGLVHYLWEFSHALTKSWLMGVHISGQTGTLRQDSAHWISQFTPELLSSCSI